MRVFVAGFQHETNTFAPSKADWAAFEAGAGWPEVTRGAAMLERLGPTTLPMGGFLRDAAERGWTPVPSIWAGAMPSAHVTRDAFERIAAAVVEDARHALSHGGLDAVYLDLHGAAVAEGIDRFVSERVGADKPRGGSVEESVVGVAGAAHDAASQPIGFDPGNGEYGERPGQAVIVGEHRQHVVHTVADDIERIGV